MEEMCRAKHGKRAQSFQASMILSLLPIPTCSPSGKLSETPPFGFVWELYYIGIIDYTIGHLATSSTSSLFSPWRSEEEWD